MMPADAGTTDAGSMPCAAPRVMCGADCVDRQTDADHCGACNDTCLGGLCSNGECLPFSYYTSSNNNIGVIRLQKNAGTGQRFLVWALQGVSGQVVMRDPYDTLGFPQLVSASARRPQDIAVEEDAIWYSTIDDDTTKAGNVYRRQLPLTTNSPVEDISGNTGSTSRQIYSVSVLNGIAYWYSVMPLRLKSFDYLRRTFTENTPNTGSSYAKFLIATPDNSANNRPEQLFYESETVPRLYSRGIYLDDMSMPTSVWQGSSPAVPGLVVQNSNSIYWAEQVSGVNGCVDLGNHCNVLEYNLNTGTVRVAVQLPMGLGAVGLFVDDNHLYYTSGDATGQNGEVAMISLAPGTSPQSSIRIANGTVTQALSGITKVDNFIFWGVNSTRSSSSEILTVRIP
jgi:hypothetical protein